MNEEGRTPAAAVEAFLSVFRRRSLTFSLLRLSLVAAVTGEAVRWSAVASNRFLGTDLPYLSTGPLLFGLMAFYAARRWSRTFTASRADQALDFRDRLASYVDFASRRDIPADLLRAQAGEVASALGMVEVRRLAPVSSLLLAGPVLLLLSVLYPNLLKTAPRIPQIFRTAMVADPVSAPGTSPLSPEPGGRPIHGTGTSHPSEAGDAESDGGNGEQQALSKTPLSNGDPAKVPKREEEGEPRRRRPPVVDAPEGERRLASKTVGSELSRVVDPVYAPPGETPPPPLELSGGSISFRLLPRAQAGNGAQGGGSSGESSSGRVTIDFDRIPERYRSIVREYFTLLADGSTPYPVSEVKSR